MTTWFIFKFHHGFFLEINIENYKLSQLFIRVLKHGSTNFNKQEKICSIRNTFKKIKLMT